MEILYHEGPANLNWGNVLASVREDFKGFVEDGGWEFLNNEVRDISIHFSATRFRGGGGR